MNLKDLVGATVRDLGARMRRDAIAYLICAACTLSAFTLATWASVLSLIPVVGVIYALLIMAGVFLLIVLATLLWLRNAKVQPRPAAAAQPFAAMPGQPAADGMQRQMQFAQIAMIVEAVLLGYSMSRKR
jgi:hypothetical protein